MFFLLMLFYFCQRLGKEILVKDWNVTINRGLGSVSNFDEEKHDKYKP